MISDWLNGCGQFIGGYLWGNFLSLLKISHDEQPYSESLNTANLLPLNCSPQSFKQMMTEKNF